MEQTVYIDIFFLINFSMDLLCFFITSRLLSHSLSPRRALIAAAVGGAYACGALFLPIGGLNAFLLDMAAGVAMSLLAVKKRGNIREALAYSVVYVAVCALLAGMMTALFSLLNRVGALALLDGESADDGVSVWLFALLAAVSGILALIGGGVWRRRSARRIGMVEISYGDAKITLRAFCDSGNLLREPVSDKLCIVVERGEMDKVLPLSLRKMIDTGKSDGLSDADAGRIRVIPTRTVNGGGMLYAVRADSVRLDMGKGWCAVDVYVAVADLCDKGMEAKALVPSTLAAVAP